MSARICIDVNPVPLNALLATAVTFAGSTIPHRFALPLNAAGNVVLSYTTSLMSTAAPAERALTAFAMAVACADVITVLSPAVFTKSEANARGQFRAPLFSGGGTVIDAFAQVVVAERCEGILAAGRCPTAVSGDVGNMCGLLSLYRSACP